MSNYSFLTVGKTQESVENVGHKKYIGIGSSYILGVNPTKKELEEIYHTEIANEPEYLIDNGESKGVRIDFITKTDSNVNNGIELISKLTFFLYNEPQYNADKTQIQVIDIYGDSAYLPIDDAKAHKIPLDSNGKPRRITADYRAAFRGEAELVEFLIKYLGIRAYSYVDNKWVLNQPATDVVFSLDKIKDYFKGDVSELKEALSLQPKNKVKLLYGIKSTEKGQFQTICTRKGYIMDNTAGTSTFSKLEDRLSKAKLAGGFRDIEYRVCPLQEYTISSTNLNTPVEDAFSESSSNEDMMPWD